VEKKNNKLKLLELISLEVLLVAGLFLLSVFAFAYLAHEVVQENEKAFDDKVANYSSPHTFCSLFIFMQENNIAIA